MIRSTEQGSTSRHNKKKDEESEKIELVFRDGEFKGSRLTADENSYGLELPLYFYSKSKTRRRLREKENVKCQQPQKKSFTQYWENIKVWMKNKILW